MNYHYLAIDMRGKRQRGQCEAKSIAALDQRLAKEGLTLIDGKVRSQKRLFSQRSALPLRERINFCFHLHQLTSAGIPLLEALKDLHDSLPEGGLRQRLTDLEEAIDGGASFSQSLARYPDDFDEVFVHLVAAGETSGQLPEMLDRLCQSLTWRDEVLSRGRRILIYPALVALTTLSAGLFLFIYLVPQLKQFIQTLGQQLPWYSRLLFGVSDFLLQNAIWLLPICLFLFLLLPFAYRLPQLRYAMDGWLLKMPILGALRQKMALARFADTLAMLYGAGIPILQALADSQPVMGNRVMESALEKVRDEIAQGQSLARAFSRSSLFLPLLVRMIGVGEQTGRLDTALDKLRHFFARDVNEAVGRAESLIGPVLTLVLGILLGWIMLAILGPIYEMVGKVRI